MNAGRIRTTTWFTQECPKWQFQERNFVGLRIGFHCEKSCSACFFTLSKQSKTSQNYKLNYQKKSLLSKPVSITAYLCEISL